MEFLDIDIIITFLKLVLESSGGIIYILMIFMGIQALVDIILDIDE